MLKAKHLAVFYKCYYESIHEQVAYLRIDYHRETITMVVIIKEKADQ